MELKGITDWEELQELGTISNRSLISPERLRQEYRQLCSARANAFQELERPQPVAGTFMGGRWKWFGSSADLLALFREIFLYQHYAPLVPLAPKPHSAGLIVDLGAHVGTFALWASLALPPRRLICFEADPTTYDVLSWNLKERLSGQDIRTLPTAILDAEGIGALESGGQERLSTMREGDNRCRNSVILLEDEPSLPAPMVDLARIPVSRIGNYLEDEVDLLKVDIEGAEIRVLKDLCSEGGIAAIRQVVMEVGPATNASALTEPNDADRRLRYVAEILQDHEHVVDVFPTSRRPLAAKDPRSENFIIRSARRTLLDSATM